MKDRRKQARTHYIHRIDYTAQERIVGLFVVIAVGILLWLLLSSGKTTAIFEESVTIYGQLESAQGVSNEAEIKISGLTAGAIRSIDIKDDKTVIITMDIHTKFHHLLRTDSTAVLTNPGIAVLGGAVINITPGNEDNPILESGSTIIIEQVASLKEALNEIIPTFEQVHTSIKQVNEILQEINPDSLGYTLENLLAISDDMRKITKKIQSGDGLVGSAIYGNEIEHDTRALLKNLVDITQTMDELISALNKEIKNMPELVDKIGPLLNQADKTIKATQRIWPLSSAIGEEKDNDILTSPAPAND